MYMSEIIEEPTPLKDGSTTLDPRLDRLPEFDERSRGYGIRTLLADYGDDAVRSFTWKCDTFNDQGREGACVGFSWSHEMAAKPVPIVAGPSTAMRIYKRAQLIDQWPGENYSGTSVLAGAKAVQELVNPQSKKSVMPEYRWAFSLKDLVQAIAYKGPAVLGVNWYQGQFSPDSDGFIHVTGPIMGGHAILAKGVKIIKLDKTKGFSWTNTDLDKSYVVLHNSWGPGWGQHGTCKISLTDLGRLLDERGEACIPVLRNP